ncbi:shikimate dehydrogenase family protein [Elioraea sp.]|uniref:shikimate dehydrogenase family protein n=1 Tax=Elioraea sp. TaxID=2185103 RepID=UPI003F70B2DD
MAIDGTTRLYGIIGDPVDRVRSPGFFNAVFARSGLNATFLPLHVAPADLAAAWDGLRRLRNLDGLSVTMPHKAAMAPLLDRLGPNAAAVRAVNTVRRAADGAWEGEMFDGEGLVAALRDASVTLEGARVHQLGAGAVGRAIAVALARAGAGPITLIDLVRGRAEEVAAMVAQAVPAVRIATSGDLAEADLVVNATPLGLRAGDALPFDPAQLRPGQVVADVIPQPEVTPLLAASSAAGCRIVTGKDMHEGQARLAAAFLGIPLGRVPGPGPAAGHEPVRGSRARPC